MYNELALNSTHTTCSLNQTSCQRTLEQQTLGGNAICWRSLRLVPFLEAVAFMLVLHVNPATISNLLFSWIPFDPPSHFHIFLNWTQTYDTIHRWKAEIASIVLFLTTEYFSYPFDISWRWHILEEKRPPQNANKINHSKSFQIICQFMNPHTLQSNWIYNRHVHPCNLL